MLVEDNTGSGSGNDNGSGSGDRRRRRRELTEEDLQLAKEIGRLNCWLVCIMRELGVWLSYYYNTIERDV